MSSARDFSGDYAPGGLTTRGKWRAAGRRGGLASGIKRRQLAKGRRVPHARDRQAALALAYTVRQVSRREFERLYAAMCASQGLPNDRRGLNTAYELYSVEIRAYRAQGQDFETTNRQRELALSSRGRPRCRRTVQLTRKRLEAMGLIRYHHIRRGGWRAGQKDTLRVQLLVLERSRRGANCTPPSGAPTPLRGVVGALPSKALIAPPAGGRLGRAAPPPSSEEGELGRAIRFQQMKLDAGWGGTQVRYRLAALRAQERASTAPEQPRSPRTG